MGPCHCGMSRPQVEDRGDGLQIRIVAATMLNRQSRTADMQWSYSLGVGRRANNFSPYKERNIMNHLHKPQIGLTL